jgi:indolepyruvate ferredoxin oxidoreductase
VNKRAFLWGRILAERTELAGEVLGPSLATSPESVDDLVGARAAFLSEYQSSRYARRYRLLAEEVKARETAVMGRPGRLSRAAAEGLFRVMAYKDEYEVARLHAQADYGERPVFHLAPPLITRTDPATGRRRKIATPGWIGLPLFHVLRHGKLVRGTPLDPFGWQAERRQERALIRSYIADLRSALAALQPETLETAIQVAELPDMIRGFGPVKDANRRKAEERRKLLLAQLAQPVMAAAAE